MIISPPFLSQPDIPVYNEQCVSDAMPGGIVGSGAFPVSQAMAWHGGIHINAPSADEPVRAIADGTVIFRRDGAVARYDAQDHSTGCVVIRHKTEIGANGTTPVHVIYYSVYQHLRQLDANLPAVNQPVYRKDRLGLPGTIYGQANRIHLEIIAGDEDTKKLVGRSTGDLAVGTDGRTDAVYGQIYVLIPANTACYGSQPGVGALPAAAGNSGGNDLIVGIKYETGNATLTTYRLSGEVVGASAPEAKAEYELFAEANMRHNLNTAGSSPSGWYELMRFGRNLGGDSLPGNAAHWRKVFLPGQPQGAWIDLNGTGTKKFSDADFPQWIGWRLIDDDAQDENSQCNSAMIDAMLAPTVQPPAPPAGPPDLASPPVPAPQLPENEQTTLEQKAANRKQNLCKPAIQAKLARTICKFPTEWVKGEVRNRWAWTREQGNPYMPYPLTDEGDFTEMAEFAGKLCFWEDLPDEDKARLTVKHWHFHPREFIKQFRQCGWLSRNEMVQLLPANSLRPDKKIWVWENVSLSGAAGLLADGDAAAEGRRVALNVALRKYCVATPVRLACFFGNATQETQWFQKFQENSPYWYKPWDGRGFLQLTHAANYIKYWNFKGNPIPAANQATLRNQTALANTNRNRGMFDPTNSLSDTATGIPQSVVDQRNSVGTDANERAQSAGAYWAWSGASEQADGYLGTSSNAIVSKATKSGSKHYYENAAFGNVAATVNIGSPSSSFSSIWGVQARFMAFANAQVILLESAVFPRADGTSSDLPEDFAFRRP